jgi:predicted ATPase
MITRVTIRNFKRIREAAIDLRDHIVFVGPNNSGKTTAIQALAVWRLALARWLEKREKSKSKATLRTGVSITRSDLMVLPLRDMRSLWHNCDVMDSESRKVRAEIFVEGSTGAKDWAFGMELEFQGSEQIYCRPMRVSPDSEDRMPVPKEARAVTVGHLPPLAGLQRIEEKANERSLKTRIAEGRAGDILRNLLYNVSEKSETDWEALKKHVADLFQVELLKPEWLSSGEILVEYHNGLRPAGKKSNPHPKLDVGMGGSGFHQVLLLLAFLYDQGGVVLLYDEPDAHLEVIRQRDVYSLLRRLAQDRNAQLIVATHSEEIMDNTDFTNMYAFLGETPKQLISRQEASQLRKSLSRISSSDYLKAKERGAVLYVEDHTDVEILKECGRRLHHDALKFLESPFTVYVGNVPALARGHFEGLKAAYPKLRGVLIIDKTDAVLQEGSLNEMMWRRREIENYLLVPAAILRFCAQAAKDTFSSRAENGDTPLLIGGTPAVQKLFKKVSRISDEEFDAPLKDSPFLLDTKASEVILEPFFKEFYRMIGQYNVMPKNAFYRIAAVMEKEEIHPEVIEKLGAIAQLS